MKLLTAFFFTGLLSASTLTGTLNYPNAAGVNGVLYFALSQQAALSAAGGCGGPIEVVPTYKVAVQIVNGAIVGSPSVYGNDCLLPQGTYYVVQFIDSNGNVQLNDWWVVTGSTFNIGTVVSSIITGTTQTLGQPGVILTAPTANQTVVQPPGTETTFNYLNVGNTLGLPDGGSCTTVNCNFGGAAFFTQGFATGALTNSVLHVGPVGELYLRTFSGADLTCTDSSPWPLNGFFAIRSDNQTMEVCVNGHTYGIALNFIM